MSKRVGVNDTKEIQHDCRRVQIWEKLEDGKIEIQVVKEWKGTRQWERFGERIVIVEVCALMSERNIF